MIQEVLVFAGVFAGSAAAPGPDTTLLFARSLAGGARTAIPLAVGITTAKLVMLSAAATGVAVALAALGPMFVVLKIAGAIYLIWLGSRMWRKRSPATAPAAEVSPTIKPVRDAATGFVLGVSNPRPSSSISRYCRPCSPQAPAWDSMQYWRSPSVS